MKNFVQHGPYIAIDFETSATSGPCACAVGMVRVENFEIVSTFYSLIRPPSSRILFSHIHGLKWSDLKNARSFAELWPDIRQYIQGARYFIAHNATFDRKVLRACCEANNLDMPRLPFLCTVLGSRRGLTLRSNSLSSVCAHLHIPLQHHHAGSDARACAQIHIYLRQMGLTDEHMRLGATARPLNNTSYLKNHE